MKQLFYISVFIFSTLFAFSQGQLSVNCYSNYGTFNSVAVDNQVVEYGCCEVEPAFYVTVFDNNGCVPLKTNFNGSHPENSFSNLNDNGSCRSREEAYFIFQLNDSVQLDGMNTLLTQLPTNYSVVIYTPGEYHGATIQNTQLKNTLTNLWDANKINGDSIMVLFGTIGLPASFTATTEQISLDQVSFTTSICQPLGLLEHSNKYDILETASSIELVTNQEIVSIELLQLNGQVLSTSKNSKKVALNASIAAGVYILKVNNKTSITNQMIYLNR